MTIAHFLHCQSISQTLLPLPTLLNLGGIKLCSIISSYVKIGNSIWIILYLILVLKSISSMCVPYPSCIWASQVLLCAHLDDTYFWALCKNVHIIWWSKPFHRGYSISKSCPFKIFLVERSHLSNQLSSNWCLRITASVHSAGKDVQILLG